MDKKERYATDPVYRKAVIERVKAYQAANKDEINARSRDRYANDPEFRAKKLSRTVPYARKSQLWKRYGLTIEGYDSMAALQGGVCIICLNPPTGKRLAVDHDRKTRKLRNLLCYKCNIGLGYYNHDPALMRRGRTISIIGSKSTSGRPLYRPSKSQCRDSRHALLAPVRSNKARSRAERRRNDDDRRMAPAAIARVYRGTVGGTVGWGWLSNA